MAKTSSHTTPPPPPPLLQEKDQGTEIDMDMEIDIDMDIEMDSAMSDAEYQKQLDSRFLVQDNEAEDEEVAHSGLVYQDTTDPAYYSPSQS